jgi:hypothetical protein
VLKFFFYYTIYVVVNKEKASVSVAKPNTPAVLNRTAEAARHRKISIGFLAVELNRSFTVTSWIPLNAPRSPLTWLRVLSVRAVSRMIGASRNTITRLLLDAGSVCAAYQDTVLRNLPAERIQCDEIWSFLGAKDRNVPINRQGEFGVGSVWSWIALDADTKFVCCWMVGRDVDAAYEFMKDLCSRLANRVQLTTDGLGIYIDAVGQTFGADIDFARLVKISGAPREAEARHSPAVCNGAKKHRITGKPERKHISTSYVER